MAKVNHKHKEKKGSQKTNFEEVLKGVGLKATPHRVLVLDFLNKEKKPFSAGDIFEKLKKEKMDKVTVYRTLEILEKNGLVKRVVAGEREARYELVDFEHDHHHIICIKCNKIEGFVGCEADDLVAKIVKKNKNFKTISHHTFDIYGVCKGCGK